MDPSQPKSQTIEGQRRLRDACDLIVAASYFAPETRQGYEALGLTAEFPTVPGSVHRGGEGYMCGRAAPLGHTTSAAVAACFGILSAETVAHALELGWAKTTPGQALSARVEAADALFDRVLGRADGRADQLAGELRNLVGSADISARPLFAALRAAEWPSSPWSRLWRAADLMREYRGASHLAVATAHLSAVELVALTNAWFGRDIAAQLEHLGHSAEATNATILSLRARGLLDKGTITTAGTGLRVEIEAATDRAMQSMFDRTPALTLLPYLESLAELFFASGDLPATRRRPPER